MRRIPAAAARAAPALPPPRCNAPGGAHRQFDGTAPARLRRDVPDGVQPGKGVHIGGRPEARAAARARLVRFRRETRGRAA